MRLKIWSVLEQTIRHREEDRTKLGRMSITRMPVERAELTASKVKDVIDYRVWIGARAKVDSGSPTAYAHARERVATMLAHEILGDLIDEIYRTEEWAFTEGYDDAMLKRIRRLANLAKGEEVE